MSSLAARISRLALVIPLVTLGVTSFGISAPRADARIFVPELLLRPAIVASHLAAPAPESSRAVAENPLRELLEDAENLESAESWKSAEYAYRKLAFATGAKKFHRKYRELLDRRVDDLLERAEKIPAEDVWEKFYLLDEAFRADADRKEALEALEELGFRWTPTGWIRPTFGDDGATVAAEAPDAEALEQARRDRILVRPNFELIQVKELAIYTDRNVRQAKSTLTQMVNANLSGHRVFAEVMAPLVRRRADEIVIVYFQKKEDYHRIGLAPAGSAGVYYSQRRAGYFFTPNFSTMLHEMAHQYTDLLLGGMRCEAWFVEGIAEYFGAASMSQGGKRMKVGIPDASRMGSFKEMAISGRVIALDRFQVMDTGLDNSLYAQAWALTHFLMEVHPAGRLYLFDYIAHHNGLAYELGIASDAQPLTLEQVMKKNGSSIAELERELFDHFGVRVRD